MESKDKIALIGIGSIGRTSIASILLSKHKPILIIEPPSDFDAEKFKEDWKKYSMQSSGIIFNHIPLIQSMKKLRLPRKLKKKLKKLYYVGS